MAMEPEKFQVNEKNHSFLPNKCLPSIISMLQTIKMNFSVKTVRLTSFHKHNINPFQSSWNLSIRASFVYLLWSSYFLLLFWTVIFMFPSIWWQLKLLEFFKLISWHRFFNNKRYTYLPWGRIALSSACSSSHSPTYSLRTVKHRTVFLASCWSFSRGSSDFLSIVAFSVLLLTEIKSADWRIWLVQFMINLSWISTYEKHETIGWLTVTTGNYPTITN